MMIRKFMGSVAALRWQWFPLNSPRLAWRACAIAVTGVIQMVIGGGRIAIFSQGGTSFSLHGPASNWTGCAVSAPGSVAQGSTLVATSGSDGVYISTDFGVSWTRRLTGVNFNHCAVSLDGLNVLAAQDSVVHRSHDHGMTWAGGAGAGPVFGSLSASSTCAKAVATDYGGTLYVSGNYGLSWVSRGPVGYWTDCAMSADGTQIIAVDTIAGTVWRSTDSGVTWANIYALYAAQTCCMSADGTKLTVATRDGMAWTSENSGTTWSQFVYPPYFGEFTGLACTADGSILIGTAGDGFSVGDVLSGQFL